MDSSPWFSAKLFRVDTPVPAFLKRDLGESIVLWDTVGLQDSDTVNTTGSHGRAWSVSDHFQPSRALVSMLSKETV